MLTKNLLLDRTCKTCTYCSSELEQNDEYVKMFYICTLETGHRVNEIFYQGPIHDDKLPKIICERYKHAPWKEQFER